MRVFHRLLAAVALLVFVLSGLAGATVHVINVQNFVFVPLKTTVVAGDTVRWVWVEGIHNSVSDPTSAKTWTSPTLDLSGETFQIQIVSGDGPGPFPYSCTFHNFPPFNMVDTLFVTPAPACCLPANKLRGDVSVCGGSCPSGDGITDGSDLQVYVDLVFFNTYLDMNPSVFTEAGPGPCPDIGDVDNSGGVDGGDLGVVVDFVFFGDTSAIRRCDGSPF